MNDVAQEGEFVRGCQHHAMMMLPSRKDADQYSSRTASIATDFSSETLWIDRTPKASEAFDAMGSMLSGVARDQCRQQIAEIRFATPVNRNAALMPGNNILKAPTVACAVPTSTNACQPMTTHVAEAEGHARCADDVLPAGEKALSTRVLQPRHANVVSIAPVLGAKTRADKSAGKDKVRAAVASPLPSRAKISRPLATAIPLQENTHLPRAYCVSSSGQLVQAKQALVLMPKTTPCLAQMAKTAPQYKFFPVPKSCGSLVVKENETKC